MQKFNFFLIRVTLNFFHIMRLLTRRNIAIFKLILTVFIYLSYKIHHTRQVIIQNTVQYEVL